MKKLVMNWLFVLGFFPALTAYGQADDSPVAKVADKPLNVVFILADDLAWNQVGYHGSSFYETPNIDAIAAGGLQFSRAYSASPVCSPSRASVMTGKNPARLKITDYIPGSPYPYALLNRPNAVPPLPLEEVTIAEMLKSKGYATGHFGKWHLNHDKNYQPGRAGDPESQGFDEILTTVKPKYDADPAGDAHHSIEITDRSLDFLDRHKNEPFFLYMAFHTVHRPLMERPELVAKYAAKPDALEPVNNPIMGAMIETMDWGVGQVMERLEQYGLVDNTLVIFYSDNGGFEQLQSQYPYRGGKAMVWEGGIRVPMAIKWPGVTQPGTVSDALVISDDFFPTFAEIFGYEEVSEEVDGLSMVPMLTGEGSNDRDTLYFHYPHFHHLGYKPAGAIRQGDYKLIEWFEGSVGGVGKAYTLYNIEADIDESDDLSAEKPELVAELAAKLRAWRKKIGAGEMSNNPDFEIQRADWRFKNSQGGDSK